ncbi:iron chelate uptake ABC transporter family permease subunit [Micromonospora tulbaghiae]|uniref:Iron complex transport system permease protein n=2 Tax=Micromonospora tulbaghiae TaxID=479978 RepID=A0ABY0KVB5_9ACTN|nr:iron chelate uptake ABC transporter family permease subunit [Micromonospora tulbaghiae]MDX5459576.1 iron chelate uptake ABC transporter family permease subunit [Micromonospora tulbaghiae]SCF15826.1 iron complex transport system permease protein [Micromonospora tulbaghiae]
MKTDLSRRVAFLLVSVALLVVAAGASMAVGARPVAPVEVWRALTDFAATTDHLVVRDIRLPRTILGVCVGAALGAAGVLIQTLTRNPLAEPGILGVTAGAGFAINLGVLVGVAGSQAGQLVLAVAGSALAAVAVYAVGRTSPLRLVLAGVALSWVLMGVSLGLRLGFPDVFDRYRFWSVGALAGAERTPLVLPVLVTVVALVAAMAATRPLNALALGEDVAHAIGAHVTRTRITVLVLVTVLTGVATAVAGPIAFVGLMVPHLARRLAVDSIPWIMAYSVLLGPILLLLADVGSRVLLPTGEVPVSIVTAFLGAPVLIWAVRRYGAAAL